MKIAIVSDAWYPQVNGVVRTLDTTRSELLKMGHEVLMITPDLFRTVPMPTYPEIRLAVLPRRRVHNMLAAFQPDAIHIATEGPLGWAARRVCLKSDLSFTTAFHTRFAEYVAARFHVPLSWSYAMLRRFHSPALRVMAATESLRKELEGRGFGRTALFSRGVDTSVFQPQQKTDLGMLRPIYTYVGRVAVEKNLEAFLSLDLPGTKVVVGDGPQLDDLREEYPEVVFTGVKRGEELARYYAQSDVFVFPSKTDTFGLVILEALACGVPVAAYPVPGPLDVLGERACRDDQQGPQAVGCLSDDLAAAIAGALRLDPEACQDFARQFSWEACTRQFVENLAPLEVAA
ncbi:MAG: glycosyltransferase [Alphaproteobacteria bacterium]|nr:glycosyltransferase [Alphaproteobacteria bacterium]